MAMGIKKAHDFVLNGVAACYMFRSQRKMNNIHWSPVLSCFGAKSFSMFGVPTVGRHGVARGRTPCGPTEDATHMRRILPQHV
jgi:hypothetical protein